MCEWGAPLSLPMSTTPSIHFSLLFSLPQPDPSRPCGGGGGGGGLRRKGKGSVCLLLPPAAPATQHTPTRATFDLSFFRVYSGIVLLFSFLPSFIGVLIFLMYLYLRLPPPPLISFILVYSTIFLLTSFHATLALVCVVNSFCPV